MFVWNSYAIGFPRFPKKMKNSSNTTYTCRRWKYTKERYCKWIVCASVYIEKKSEIFCKQTFRVLLCFHTKKTCRFAMVCKRHRNGRQQSKQKVSARIASTTKMYANYFSIVNKKRQQERTRRCHTISLVQLRSVSSMQQKNICEPKVHSIECVGWMIMLLWSIQANTKRIALKYEKIGIYAQILSHWQQCKMNEFLQ